ncbi:hypothetical protein [Nonomuraea sp. SBT364]|uniref:hypothetical protein n=1 Tax=Nonomuraea sp. SBT364 TaxID=1580530 RepID=UPI00066B2B91|nr:hypothetical protein [Nonomuraea sp. SBT364]
MKSELKYKTVGGNIVTWKRAAGWEENDKNPWGGFKCDGCGASDTAYPSQAANHALTCRAL